MTIARLKDDCTSSLSEVVEFYEKLILECREFAQRQISLYKEILERIFIVRLSEFIKQKRLNAVLTQQEAVSLLGYKKTQFLSNLERGLRKPPLEILKRMCEVYRISQEEMRIQYIQEAKVDAEEKAIRKWDCHFTNEKQDQET